MVRVLFRSSGFVEEVNTISLCSSLYLFIFLLILDFKMQLSLNAKYSHFLRSEREELVLEKNYLSIISLSIYLYTPGLLGLMIQAFSVELFR